MISKLNLSLFVEVGLLIPTGISIVVKMTSLDSLSSWYLMVLFGTTALCVRYSKGVKTEIVKAFCSIAISLILIFNLTNDQNILDVLALLAQIFLSGLIIKNLIENYSSYK